MDVIQLTVFSRVYDEQKKDWDLVICWIDEALTYGVDAAGLKKGDACSLTLRGYATCDYNGKLVIGFANSDLSDYLAYSYVDAALTKGTETEISFSMTLENDIGSDEKVYIFITGPAETQGIAFENASFDLKKE